MPALYGSQSESLLSMIAHTNGSRAETFKEYTVCPRAVYLHKASDEYYSQFGKGSSSTISSSTGDAGSGRGVETLSNLLLAPFDAVGTAFTGVAESIGKQCGSVKRWVRTEVPTFWQNAAVVGTGLACGQMLVIVGDGVRQWWQSKLQRARLRRAEERGNTLPA
ncbi:unnamed protein product [Amoebophrya sp. A25]|nr:unnamed protein product [Amoebophrya sp. A25]|eukprot:GSA25T00011394001.1